MRCTLLRLKSSPIKDVLDEYREYSTFYKKKFKLEKMSKLPSFPLPLQREDVQPHPESSSTENLRIEIAGKFYDFSREMVNKYPKLQDPAARYTLGFDSILPLIYDYPASCIPPSLIDEPHEKTLFLSNCEFFGISLSDDVILHLNKETKKDLEKCQSFIEEEVGRKGRNKIRFSIRKDIRVWARELENASQEIYQGLKPIEIIEMMEEGSLDILALHDWKYKNCVRGFVKLFMEKFFPKAS